MARWSVMQAVCMVWPMTMLKIGPRRSLQILTVIPLVALANCTPDRADVEQDLTGKWVYHHDYDDSDEDHVFDADRTGCEFEYDTHNSRSETKDVTYWAFEDQGEDLFFIRLTGPEMSSKPLGYLTSDEYHHELDEIGRGGYDTLRMRPTPTDRRCN
jgi:hypothetical protein